MQGVSLQMKLVGKLFLWLLCVSPQSVAALSVQCEPISSELGRIEVSTVGTQLEVFIQIPMEHEGAQLRSASVTYQGKISVPAELWPSDEGMSLINFVVAPGAGAFGVHATYTAGACVHEYRHIYSEGAEAHVEPAS